MTHLLLHFFKLDLNIAKKYQVKILFNFFHVLCIITLFYYISKTIGIIKILDAPYFPFVSTGLAFSYLTSGVINSSANKVTEWRDLGILEGLLLSPKKPWKIYLTAGIMENFISILKFGLILAAISFFFLGEQNFNPLLLAFSTAIIFGLAVNLSLIETCSILIWKRWSLLSSLSSLSALFLSGVYFPVQILPPFFHWVAVANPFFHGLLLIRKSLGIASPDNQLVHAESSAIILIAWFAATLLGAFIHYRISEKHLYKTGGHLHI